MEKLIIECTLELFAKGLINGIQDWVLRASCATSELASAGDGGMRDAGRWTWGRGPHPEEILMSESQERMMAVAKPRTSRSSCRLLEAGRRATVIGEAVEGDRLTIDYQGASWTSTRAPSLTRPVYNRPYHRRTD